MRLKVTERGCYGLYVAQWTSILTPEASGTNFATCGVRIRNSVRKAKTDPPVFGASIAKTKTAKQVAMIGLMTDPPPFPLHTSLVLSTMAIPRSSAFFWL